MTKIVHDEDEGGDNKGHWEIKRSHVVEQRVSNLAQGLLTLGTMSGPLLVVLHLIPQGVLAGLFFIMGYQALEGNGITAKILFLVRDRTLTDKANPLHKIERRWVLWLFVAIELVAFGATFAITQTVAAVGFPCFILALIPLRALILPRIFYPHELGILDGPTASPFTMESVGGVHGAMAPVEDEAAEAEDESFDSSSEDTATRRTAATVGVDSSKGGILSGDGLDGNRAHELAELGENQSVRLAERGRRSSAVAADEDDTASEVARPSSGVSRRHMSRA